MFVNLNSRRIPEYTSIGLHVHRPQIQGQIAEGLYPVEGNQVGVVLVLAAAGGAGDDQEVVTGDDLRGVAEGLHHAPTHGHAAGLEPVERVHAVHEHQDAPLVARRTAEADATEGFPVLPRVGGQGHRGPVQVVFCVMDDLELALGARHGVELDETVVQGLAVVLDPADGGQARRRVAVDDRALDHPDLAVHQYDVAFQEAVGRHLILPAFRVPALRKHVRDAREPDVVGHAPGRRIEQVARQVAGHHQGLPVEAAGRVAGLEGAVGVAVMDQHRCGRAVVPALEERDGPLPVCAAVAGSADDDIPALPAVADEVGIVLVRPDRRPDEIQVSREGPRGAVVVADQHLGLIRHGFLERAGAEPLVTGQQASRAHPGDRGRTDVHVLRVRR